VVLARAHRAGADPARGFVALSALAASSSCRRCSSSRHDEQHHRPRRSTEVDWIWPFTVVLFAISGAVCAVRRLVNPFLGFFIATYDISSPWTRCSLRGVAWNADARRCAHLPGRHDGDVRVRHADAAHPRFAVLSSSRPMIAPAFPPFAALPPFRLGLALVAGSISSSSSRASRPRIRR